MEKKNRPPPPPKRRPPIRTPTPTTMPSIAEKQIKYVAVPNGGGGAMMINNGNYGGGKPLPPMFASVHRPNHQKSFYQYQIDSNSYQANNGYGGKGCSSMVNGGDNGASGINEKVLVKNIHHKIPIETSSSMMIMKGRTIENNKIFLSQQKAGGGGGGAGGGGNCGIPSYTQHQYQRQLQQIQQQNSIQQRTLPPHPPAASLYSQMKQQQQHPQQISSSSSSPSTTTTIMTMTMNQQQQQQKPPPPPPAEVVVAAAASRIPTTITSTINHQQQQQPNFNQISKTATNLLLNDIYEKHLLNQTKFEMKNFNSNNGSGGGGVGGGTASGSSDLNAYAGGNEMQRVHGDGRGDVYETFESQNMKIMQHNNNNNLQSKSLMMGGGIGGGGVPASEHHKHQQHYNNKNQIKFHHENSSLSNHHYRKGNNYKSSRSSLVTGFAVAATPGPKFDERGIWQLGAEGGGGGGGGVIQSNDEQNLLLDVNFVTSRTRNRRKLDNNNLNMDYGNAMAGVSLRRAQPIGGNFSMVHHSPASAPQSVEHSTIDQVDDSIITGGGGNVKFEYRNSKINLMLETAQAIAAAAYYARTAQKMTSNGVSGNKTHRTTDVGICDRGGFCGAIQRAPPTMPSALARRLANKENPGLGKVKVMLRVSDNPPEITSNNPPCYLSIDKKKRQVTLSDPSSMTTTATLATTTTATTTSSSQVGVGIGTSGNGILSSQERGPMVAAPKMFAFDSLFTNDDTQSDVCSSALSEVIPAVLEGSDGCLLTLGYPGAGQTRTMFGSISSANDLGAIPCAISWLYKGINEKRQKSGARFSVRVSALGVNATKPGSTSKDLLAAHATESDDSPGVYLRDDFLGGPTELRAPTPERAALFLDAALAGRPSGNLEPAFIFTLHVYQYSLAGRGGVAGGRSRLHLIDLGGCANRTGGMPLSGIGNVLLSILSGQRHPPNREHPLTPLLKDCLAPLTCHVAVLAHILHSQTHSDALTTIQLASRIHRMRRRKHRFPMSVDKHFNNPNQNSGGSSEGPDPSSSDFSADTVIYMGPSDETDGEHPPVYIPSINSEDNRCAMNKALKGSGAEKPSKIPAKKSSNSTIAKPQSPVPVQRVDSPKRSQTLQSHSPSTNERLTSSPIHGSPIKMAQQNIYSPSPKLPSSPYKYPQSGVNNKGSNVPTPKGSPSRRPNNVGIVPQQESPKRKTSEEKWIDGPRVSRAKVAEARHLLREINHVKQCETWIDGPNTQPPRSLTATSLPGVAATVAGGYGFMDSHKKTMIRQWVENQTTQILTTSSSTTSSPQHTPVQKSTNFHLTQFKTSRSENDQNSVENNPNDRIIDPISKGFNILQNGANSSECCIRTGLISTTQSPSVHDQCDMHSEKSHVSSIGGGDHNPQNQNNDSQEEEDQDSGPSEVPPALPLIETLSSREISHDSLHLICSRHMSRDSLSVHSQTIQMMDCGLQVTEEEIARTMGACAMHPLSALSNAEISVVSSFNVGDAFSECGVGDRTRHQFDQLARLRELFTSQLAMAEVTPAYKIGDAGSVYSEPAFRYAAGPGSVCSEPAYRPPSPTRCRGCRQSNTNLSRTPSQASLPSLNGIMQIAGMEQYASLRHPDGASDPNLQIHKSELRDKLTELKENFSTEKVSSFEFIDKKYSVDTPLLSQTQLPQLPPLPLSTPEAYDSGHDSTPRTSKHSGISWRAESGYHSVATVRDSDESSFGSAGSRAAQKITAKKKRPNKSLCHWLKNPFTCTYPDTEGEVSDF